MAKRSSLRASDADRDRVADRLHRAAIEGRLLAHELEERLAQALRARTYGELDALVEDLPGARPADADARRGGGLGLGLARRYPLAVVVTGCVVGVAIVAVAATAFALIASGLWVLPLVAMFALRGRRRRGPRGRRGLGYVHVRRYSRF